MVLLPIVVFLERDVFAKSETLMLRYTWRFKAPRQSSCTRDDERDRWRENSPRDRCMWRQMSLPFVFLSQGDGSVQCASGDVAIGRDARGSGDEEQCEQALRCGRVGA